MIIMQLLLSLWNALNFPLKWNEAMHDERRDIFIEVDEESKINKKNITIIIMKISKQYVKKLIDRSLFFAINNDKESYTNNENNNNNNINSY